MAQGQEESTPQTTEAKQQQVAGQGQAESPESSQPQETLSPDEFLAKTGFKSLDDAFKSLKEAQAKITKTAQEKAQLEQVLQDINAMQQGGQNSITPPAGTGQGVDFFEDIEGNVTRLARQIAAQEVQGAVQQLEARQNIERVRAENPARFDALRPIMQQIFVEKPFLNNLGEEGLRQAMEEAAQRRQQYLADLKAEMFPESNTGTSKEQVKQELLEEMNRNKQAMIPQSGVSRPITDDVKKKIAEARDKGDVDGVLDNLFKTVNP